jgi:hypothetical protein
MLITLQVFLAPEVSTNELFRAAIVDLNGFKLKLLEKTQISFTKIQLALQLRYETIHFLKLQMSSKHPKSSTVKTTKNFHKPSFPIIYINF